jgi:glyoxylase-like metal-dependent hydrolase (beta-lactamase superfamily II)
MIRRQIRKGLHQIRFPGVNGFLLESKSDGLVLIDAGVEGSEGRVIAAVESLGRDYREIRHILVTHCHPDHAGGLAALKALTGARIYMHKRDAMLVAAGRAMRRMVPSPGLWNRILFQIMIAPKLETVPPVKVDVLVENGDEIPVAGGISVIHTPGHTEGHLVFISRKHGAAFLGDAAANLLGLSLMMGYEHVQQGVMSLQYLSRFDFDVACFGHGQPILSKAGDRFRGLWGRRTAVRS